MKTDRFHLIYMQRRIGTGQWNRENLSPTETTKGARRQTGIQVQVLVQIRRRGLTRRSCDKPALKMLLELLHFGEKPSHALGKVIFGDLDDGGRWR